MGTWGQFGEQCWHMTLPFGPCPHSTFNMSLFNMVLKRVLFVAGTFGLSDMHGWVSQLLNDLPPTLPDSDQQGHFCFCNTLLGTQLTTRWVVEKHALIVSTCAS